MQLLDGGTTARAMSRDALFHGPIAAGLLLLILPNYDLRFPTGWSFQPKFVIGAIWPFSYPLASLLGERPDSLWLEEPDSATPADRFPSSSALSVLSDYVSRVWSALPQSRLHVLRS